MASTAVRPTSLPPWTYRSLIWVFAQRDLKARFKGTVGGWMWSLLLPLATVVIYSVVFSLVIRVQPPPFGNGSKGVYFVWLLVGLVPWNFFSSTVLMGMPSLLSSGGLLQKVYFPSYIPIISMAIAVGVQSLIELGIVAAILLFFGSVGWSWLLVPVWLVIFVLFTVSVSYVFAVANVHTRDVAQILGVIMQLVFFMTPIIFPITMIPVDFHGIPARAIVAANPLAAFLIDLRSLVYELRVPDITEWGYLLLWTVGILLVATWVYRKWGQDIGESV